MNNYERGFREKCNEYGVDPNELIKQAIPIPAPTGKAVGKTLEGSTRIKKLIAKVLNSPYAKYPEGYANAGFITNSHNIYHPPLLRPPKFSPMGDQEGGRPFLQHFHDSLANSRNLNTRIKGPGSNFRAIVDNETNVFP